MISCYIDSSLFLKTMIAHTFSSTIVVGVNGQARPIHAEMIFVPDESLLVTKIGNRVAVERNRGFVPNRQYIVQTLGISQERVDTWLRVIADQEVLARSIENLLLTAK